MSKKTMLIINPVSGKGKVKAHLLPILSTLGAGGDPVTVYMTEKSGDATAFAGTYGAQYDRIVCTGGDGTLNEVINGLMLLPKEDRPQVGYFPLGTTNDMAATLGIPKSPEDVLGRLAQGNTRTVDIGQLGDKYFGYVAAFGIFTEIPYMTPQAEKNSLGYLAYVLQALSSLGEINTPYHARIEYDGGVLEDDYILGAVANSTTVAGFVKLNPEDVSLDDGLFEVLLIKHPKNAADLNAIAGMLRKNFSSPQVTLLHTKDITFHFDTPVNWTRDGEDGGSHTTVSIHNSPRSVEIIV